MTETYSAKKKNFHKKPGKTILIKYFDVEDMNKHEINFTGLENNTETQNKSRFLVFDNVENSKEAFNELKKNKNILVKFATYKLFFTIKELNESYEYDKIKQVITDYVTSKVDSDVLYFRLYRKNNVYLGCGELTLDTKSGMDKILDKENDIRNFTTTELNISGSFYRFKKANFDIKGDKIKTVDEY